MGLESGALGFINAFLVSGMLSYDPLSPLELRLGFWVLVWFWVWLYMGGPGDERRRPCGLMLMLFWGLQWRGVKWGFLLRVLMWLHSDVIGGGFGAWGVPWGCLFF